MKRETIFSPDRKYRYTLWREWSMEHVQGATVDDGGYVMFIGLNPSTADETLDDPTIRRCKAFARAWHFPAMCMTNLFAWRSVDPEVLPFVGDPVGMQNNAELCRIAQKANLIVACWGTKAEFSNQADFVKKMMFDIGVKLHCLRKTKQGHPGHPLYLPKTLTPIEL